MPLEPNAEQRIEEDGAEVAEGTEYTVTATPASGWYGVVSGSGGSVIGDTAGAPVSFSLTPTDNAGTILFGVNAGAAADDTEEGQHSIVTLSISHRRTD